MNGNTLRLVLCTCLGLALLVTTETRLHGVPAVMNYQGKIDVEGEPFSGTGRFRFAIVDETGTEYFWSNDGGFPPQEDILVSVNEGLYTVLLGDPDRMDALPPSVFDEDDLFLRIWFDDDQGHGLQQLDPDQRIVSVGFAMRAGEANTLNGMESEQLLTKSELSAVSITEAGGNLAAALSTIGSEKKTLLINQKTEVTADTEIPENVTLQFTPGGVLNVGTGNSLIVKGEIQAGVYQIFSGSGTVKGYKTGKTSEARPEWWGAKGDWSNSDFPPSNTDDTAAIQAALDFFDTQTPGDTGGRVIFRSVGYRCTGSLQMHDGSRLIGAGSAGIGQAGTVLRHDPPIPGPDVPFIHAVSSTSAYTYANIIIENVNLMGNYNWETKEGTSQYGLFLDACRACMKNVTISLFKEYGLRVGYGINSTYERVCCNQCETGLIVDMGSHTPSGITTSQSFLACRFNSCTVGAEIGKYVESIWFGGNTIFEGTTEVGIRINDAVQVTLDSCYWEGNHGIYLQAGNTGLVHSLRVTNPTLIGKSPPDPTSFIYDIFSLDQVRWADIDLGAVATGPKAAILRTTENTVKVTYRAPAHTSSYLGAGAPRQKNHAYDLGEVVQVTEEGPSAYGAPRTLQFVCIEAGTTEDLNQGDPGWVKKYSWNATSVPDGTAKFSMTGFECVQDFSQLYSVGTHYGNPGTDDARIATRRLELHDGSNHSWWNVRTGYSFSQEDFMIENQGATGAGRILWARSAVHGKGNQMVLGGDPDHPWFSPHNFMIKRDVKIDGPAESGLEVLQLYQQDDDEPFIEFRGAPADEPSKCISNYTNGSSIAGFIRVSINGADYWMPFYTAPTAP